MIIVKQYPPNYAKIQAAFGLDKNAPIVFTYGDRIYNPTSGNVDDALVAHEETHCIQQAKIGIERWWDEYLKNPHFRMEQEIEAYRRQYKFAKAKIKDRNMVSRFLVSIARDLSGPMYGNVVNFQEAMKIIKQ
jgi:hypothetical protein